STRGTHTACRKWKEVIGCRVPARWTQTVGPQFVFPWTRHKQQSQHPSQPIFLLFEWHGGSDYVADMSADRDTRDIGPICQTIWPDGTNQTQAYQLCSVADPGWRLVCLLRWSLVAVGRPSGCASLKSSPSGAAADARKATHAGGFTGA